jgi:hypothetical protein
MTSSQNKTDTTTTLLARIYGEVLFLFSNTASQKRSIALFSGSSQQTLRK